MKPIKRFLLFILPFIIFSCSTENTPVYQLTTSPDPSEAGMIEPAGDEYDEGAEVTITATPNEGWIFDGWQGDLNGTENPQNLTMDSDKNITALFIKKTYSLTVTVEGEGTVQEAVIQEKSMEYEHGTRVELTAEPEFGWEFTGWSGSLESTENPVQLTVEEPAEIIATFETSNTFFLAENGITIKCPTAEVGEKGMVDGVEYEAVDRELLDQRINEEVDLTKICTSLVTDMSDLFWKNETFNQAIGNWDVGSVINMSSMFSVATLFNQSLENWNVSNVMNMEGMFHAASSFNQTIEEWNVSNVTNMKGMFSGAENFNQPIGNWDISNVSNMSNMFQRARKFNREITGWNVSNVTEMVAIFYEANSFNQPIGSWNVGKVTNMNLMFYEANSFNQPIGEWDVSDVRSMSQMFEGALAFNQSVEEWNVSNVSAMSRMFYNARLFNQPIGNWDVSNVTHMNFMFTIALSFNQPINGWDVSNVTNMNHMFHHADSFNQPLGDWDVSNVTIMLGMFNDADIFNQDLSTWCVSNFDSEPEEFSEESPLEEEHKPIWGTCPD